MKRLPEYTVEIFRDVAGWYHWRKWDLKGNLIDENVDVLPTLAWARSRAARECGPNCIYVEDDHVKHRYNTRWYGGHGKER